MTLNNTYGTVKPSNINPALDVEIWYQYRPNRAYDESNIERFKKLDSPATILEPARIEDNSRLNGGLALNGMYTLKLPVSIFGAVGIYTIYIIPREIKCTIQKIGNLAAYPDIRGIVVSRDSIEDEELRTLFESGNLTGYRIEYYNDDASERQDFYRIITSNNKCEVMSGSLSSVNGDLTSYRFTEASNLMFITVSPSTSPTFMSNVTPTLGMPGQRIGIINTKFDPVALEVEICENDLDSIALSLDGDQTRSLDKGTVTTFNKDGEIYQQHEFSTVKSNYTHKDIYELRQRRTDNIDTDVPAPSSF